MKKIRIFLGAYINSTNAQNLNCLSLARHLDKERFEVYTLTLYSGDLEPPKIEGVKTFSCFKPHSISRYLGFLWGILRCDIAYLPKGELCRWNKFWIRLLGKKSFRTVEGIYGEEMLGQVLENGMSYEEFKKWFQGYDRLYSITKFLANYNRKHHGIKSEPEPLYLGTETEVFQNDNKEITALKNIVFIGRIKRRKGVFELLDLAQTFPMIQFHLVGEG
jgi:glycosyltransferase involved in cell wall biosynthesis